MKRLAVGALMIAALVLAVPSVVLGVVSSSAIETPLPRTSISGAGVAIRGAMVYE